MTYRNGEDRTLCSLTCKAEMPTIFDALAVAV
jgi:hypothetical protein